MKKRIRQLEQAVRGRHLKRAPLDPETAVKRLRARIWWRRIGEEPPAALKRWVCIPPRPGRELRGISRREQREARVDFAELLQMMGLEDERDLNFGLLPSAVVGDESWVESFRDPEPSPVPPGCG